MTSDVDNLVRGELSEVREGVRILQVRMTSLEENTAASELNAGRDFLRQADMLVAGVRSLFLNMGDSTAATRLKDNPKPFFSSKTLSNLLEWPSFPYATCARVRVVTSTRGGGRLLLQMPSPFFLMGESLCRRALF